MPALVSSVCFHYSLSVKEQLSNVITKLFEIFSSRVSH